jgi:hypothetical protein
MINQHLPLQEIDAQLLAICAEGDLPVDLAEVARLIALRQSAVGALAASQVSPELACELRSSAQSGLDLINSLVRVRCNLSAELARVRHLQQPAAGEKSVSFLG